jgi:rhodanese-related sulfurtransferase
MRNLLFVAAAIGLVTPMAEAQFKVNPDKPGHVAIPQSPSNSGVLQITPSNGETNPAAAKRISFSDAAKLVRSGKAIYVDVRSRETYDLGHIPGAISMPGSQLINRITELPPGKTFITYCACVEEHTAAVAVLNLNSHGLKNAAALIGGWNSWKAAGLPIEVSGAVPAKAARKSSPAIGHRR